MCAKILFSVEHMVCYQVKFGGLHSLSDVRDSDERKQNVRVIKHRQTYKEVADVANGACDW